MTIQTNTENRKALAAHISGLIGEPCRYQGVPSCAYQIGPYTVNRDGSITGEDFGAIRSFLLENGYISESIENHSELQETGTASEDDTGDPEERHIDGMSISIPLSDFSCQGLTCLLKTLYTRQTLINAMTTSDKLFIDEEVVNRLADEKPEMVEDVLSILQGEIEADMIRGIAVEDGKIIMDFPYDETQPTKWQAYAELLRRVAARSREAHHATVKKLEPEENEMKYFCRNWLMQLGLGGPEHKEARRVLLGHLTGFAAFRTAEKMDAHKTRCAERRREARKDSKAQAATEMEVEADD